MTTHERQAHYSYKTVLALIDGEFWDSAGHHDREQGLWIRLRSRVEASGQVDSEAWMTVLDLERALVALAGGGTRDRDQPVEVQRQRKAAAALVSARLLLDYDAGEMTQAFGRRIGDPDRLIRRAAAFMAAWLSGGDARACDDAWRHTR